MDANTRAILFAQLRDILDEFAFQFEIEASSGKYSLSTTKLLEYEDKLQEGIYFCGLRELKSIVGFYFMPILTDPDLIEKIPFSLAGIQKGDNCFNIKSLTPQMASDIRLLMKVGIERYKEKDWL